MKHRTSLLAIAYAYRAKRASPISDDEIDVAIACVRGDITHGQATTALKIGGAWFYTKVARCLRYAYEKGQLKAKKPRMK